MCCWKTHDIMQFYTITTIWKFTETKDVHTKKLHSAWPSILFWWKCSLCNLLRERCSAKCQPQSSWGSRKKQGLENNKPCTFLWLCQLLYPITFSYIFFYRDLLYTKFYPAWNFLENIRSKTGAKIQANFTVTFDSLTWRENSLHCRGQGAFGSFPIQSSMTCRPLGSQRSQISAGGHHRKPKTFRFFFLADENQ